MDFDANKTLVDVIKDVAFEGKYFREIFSGFNGKLHRKSYKKFFELKNVDQSQFCSNYYDVNANNYVVRCGTSFRICENTGWISFIDNYGWFQWYLIYSLGTTFLKNERKIKRWKGFLSKFKAKLSKIIKDITAKFDYYSI